MEQNDKTLQATTANTFRGRLGQLATWTAISASRSRDLRYEWPAVGMALASLHLLLIVAPNDFLDVSVLIGTLGAGFSLGRFEHRSSLLLKRLARDLVNEADATQASDRYNAS